MILEYLGDNNLIICETTTKQKLIEEINSSDKLISYKIMDLKEFLSNYFFSYDRKTIHYLIKKLNIKYEIALEYLESLYFIQDKKYSFDKLNNLVELKKELFQNNLLETNSNFLNYLNTVNIIIYGYDLDPFYLKIFNKYNYREVKPLFSKKEKNVYEFTNIDSEVAFICSDIKKRLDNGVDISKIKIIANGSEYDSTLKRVFNWHKLPLDIVNKISLFDIPVSKKIINLLLDNTSFSDIISTLSDIDSEILNKIIDIFNNYACFNYETKDLVELIIYDLKHTYLKSKHLKNAITISSFDTVNDGDICYLLGFNKENYPKVYKDEDFLSDKMKEELGIFSSNKKNILEKEKLLNNLNKDVTYIITYKLKDSFNNYNPSLLIEEENMNIIKNPKIDYTVSNFYNRITLAKEYDNFYKYGIISDDLKLLKENYKDLEYNTYDNSFTGLDNSSYLKYLEKLTLSYTQVDSYFRCGFRYYISNILKIKEEDTDEFYMQIGNIFHYVLSKYKEDDFNFETEWNKEASKYTFTLNKLIFLEKLKQELKFDLEIIKKQENYSKMNDYLFENRFSVKVENSKNIDVTFTGVVDKIVYSKNDNQTLVSIIDYKTGSLPSNLNNIIYGIGMQLPIYLYLVKRSNLFNDIVIVGFYLQKIINKDMKATLNKTIQELKENALKLVGYSNIDTDILSNFDMTYNDSNLISGLKTKQDGFYAYSKVLDQDEIDNLDKLVDDKIKESTNNILENNFMINPKKIGKDIVGCEFCSYRDICYKKEEDYKELLKYDRLEFLGSDNNA